MNRNQFRRFFELYYDLTDGRPQVDGCPDMRIEINSISSSIKIRVYINGYTTDDKPDLVLLMDNETADDYINWALGVIEKLVEIKRISMSNPFYDIRKEKLIDILLKSS